MKKIVFLTLSLLVAQRALGCDFCNCLRGINPYYSFSNGLGVHLLFQRSEHHAQTTETETDAVVSPSGIRHGIHHAEDVGVSVERRTTLELSYQHHFSDKWMTTVLVPYSFTTVASSSSFSKSGFGDITLLGHYSVLFELGDTWNGRLMFGAGIKLPVGTNTFTNASGERLDPSLQLGSGSTDFVANGTFIAQHGAWSFAIDGYGKLNTQNSHSEKFGNSVSVNSSIAREVVRNNASLFGVVAVAGMRLEHAGYDRNGSTKDTTSEFTSMYVNIGTQMYYGVVRVDASVLIPAMQERPPGSGTEDTRFMTGIRLEL